MLRGLRDFLDELASPRDRASAAPPSMEMASAVLLVEVMRSDGEASPAERAAVLRMLQRTLGADVDAPALLEAAEEASRRANDFYTFTSVLNERMAQAQKIELVERMWRVAYLDGSADPGETSVISKVAGLLHVTHGEYIAAKMRAQPAD